MVAVLSRCTPSYLEFRGGNALKPARNSSPFFIDHISVQTFNNALSNLRVILATVAVPIVSLRIQYVGCIFRPETLINGLGDLKVYKLILAIDDVTDEILE